jgi:hypothetical protein
MMTPRRVQLASIAIMLAGCIIIIPVGWLGTVLIMAGVGLTIRAMMAKCRYCGMAIGRPTTSFLLPKQCRFCRTPF